MHCLAGRQGGHVRWRRSIELLTVASYDVVEFVDCLRESGCYCDVEDVPFLV